MTAHARLLAVLTVIGFGVLACDSADPDRSDVATPTGSGDEEPVEPDESEPEGLAVPERAPGADDQGDPDEPEEPRESDWCLPIDEDVVAYAVAPNPRGAPGTNRDEEALVAVYTDGLVVTRTPRRGGAPDDTYDTGFIEPEVLAELVDRLCHADVQALPAEIGERSAFGGQTDIVLGVPRGDRIEQVRLHGTVSSAGPPRPPAFDDVNGRIARLASRIKATAHEPTLTPARPLPTAEGSQESEG